MDFPEVDHNPPMDYPGSMSEVLGCCLDSAPRAGAQGEFAAFCSFPVLALPFCREGELQQGCWGNSPEAKPFPCRAAGGICWERRLRALKANFPARAPRATEPHTHTGHQTHKLQLAFVSLWMIGLSQNRAFPLFPGISIGSRKQVSTKLALPYLFHFCDRDSFPSDLSTLRWWH